MADFDRSIGPSPESPPGGTYGQGDISPAAQKSRYRTTRADEPTIAPAEPNAEPMPPDAPGES